MMEVQEESYFQVNYSTIILHKDKSMYVVGVLSTSLEKKL